MLQLTPLSFKGPFFMDRVFKRTIKVLLSIFQWRELCFWADYYHKSDHFKMSRALMAPHIIFSPQIAQGYFTNSTYAHFCANIPPCYTQSDSGYLLLAKLDPNFLLDNMTWRISLAFGFTCLLTSAYCETNMKNIQRLNIFFPFLLNFHVLFILNMW